VSFRPFSNANGTWDGVVVCDVSYRSFSTRPVSIGSLHCREFRQFLARLLTTKIECWSPSKVLSLLPLPLVSVGKPELRFERAIWKSTFALNAAPSFSVVSPGA